MILFPAPQCTLSPETCEPCNASLLIISSATLVNNFSTLSLLHRWSQIVLRGFGWVNVWHRRPMRFEELTPDSGDKRLTLANHTSTVIYCWGALPHSALSFSLSPSLSLSLSLALALSLSQFTVGYMATYSKGRVQYQVHLERCSWLVVGNALLALYSSWHLRLL